jgi:hypothetical protein
MDSPNEQFVREYVERPHFITSAAHSRELWRLDIGFGICGGPTQDDCWETAAMKIRERLEEIRQVQEEIEWLKKQRNQYYESEVRTVARIITARQDALAALKKGMR